MSVIFTIIKKEFARFFKDIRLLLTALLLPGIMIFAVYSLIGTIMSDIAEKEAAKQASVYVVNMPESQSAFNSVFDVRDDYTVSEAFDAVKSGSLDLFVSFPENFDELVASYEVSSGTPAPNVEIYYNSAETVSVMAFQNVSSILSQYEGTLANKFDINRPAADGSAFDLADSASATRTVMSMVVPMVLLMLLFSGCMAVAPESIAGEKERGTIATLLVTPVKRSSVAIGKIAALSVIALLSGLSSATGMLLSLPRLAGGSGMNISLSIFGFGEIMAVLAVILSSVLIMVTLISIISAYAKSVKEANGLVVPIMILVMICGIASMFTGGASSIGFSFIPLFNSALAISSIISGTLSAAAVAVTVCVNIAVSALLVFILTLMFNSERIMFNK